MIRKIFNTPNKKQLELLHIDSIHILQKCSSIADTERKELRENQEILDGTCSKCMAKKEDIVDKIVDVQGFGNINGNFYLGFGNVKGSMIIKTVGVNHCNKCGNQWGKFKTKSISETDILRVCLNYLSDILNNPEEKKRSWKKDSVEVFEGCYAETIYGHVIKQADFLHKTTVSTLTISKLRQYYKSIYDRK
jgi:hypothetical protein